MFAVPKTRELPAVGVLLGGSGRARVPTLQAPPVAALMRPFALASVQVCEASENRVAGDRSC